MGIRRFSSSKNLISDAGFASYGVVNPIDGVVIDKVSGSYVYAFVISGSTQVTFPQSGFPVEYLIIGGGGGGGKDMGGGGGAGGFIAGTTTIESASQTIVVGMGGYGAPAAGSWRNDGTGPEQPLHQYTIPAVSGSPSFFNGLTALGGGFGGSSYRVYTPGMAGGSGGSGGGSSGYNDGTTLVLGGLGTTGQGNRGGNCNSQYHSGGGGGAGSAGIDGPNQPHGGNGLENSILGVSYYWAGGGGGSSYSLSNGGNGGIGGGGGGAVGTTTGGTGWRNGLPGDGGSPNAQTNRVGGSAGPNTGGGGGGGSHYNGSNSGGEGGNGVVIIKYPASYGVLTGYRL